MEPNFQPREKLDRRNDGELNIHSIFPTMQGEGPFAGTRALFIRLAGCNLNCYFCDTDYTSKRENYSVDRLIDQVCELWHPGELVVITGGEPFRQNLTPFVGALLEEGFKVQIETNGTLYHAGFPYEEVTIVCSPKKARIAPKLMPHIDALKYVLTHGKVDSDGLPKEVLKTTDPNNRGIGRPNKDFKGEIYVQPLDEQNESNNALHLRATVDSVLKHGYRLCIQTHKLCGVE